MKDSSVTSAKATGLPRPAGQSSARPHSLISADFALKGPSDLPDPATHAFRKDLADVALAGRVIASHYAVPVDRTVAAAAPLLSGPGADCEVIARLAEGDSFAMLDDSLGWAWGYAGEDRLVGYVAAAALKTA